MNSFRYILRYYIDPGFHEDDRIAELTDFCCSSDIEEVMLFFNAEETNTGHYTMQELEAWLPTARKVKKALSEKNIDLSLNPWTTVVHSPRARKLKPGQNYTLMVGDTGENNGVTACPMDPNWLEDLTELWVRAVAELHPVGIWIEDDFRYHNHGNVLGVGGCYCQLHLNEFSRRVGRPVQREELLSKVFAPGIPHPWRKIWLDMIGEPFVFVAEKLRSAIQNVSPETKVGLMSGYFDSLSAEGRRWDELQVALSGAAGMMFRPTMSPYTEVWSLRKIPVNSRMTSIMFHGSLIYPELESGPRHGAYSMGCGYAGWQILETCCFGAHGVTMNCYDMLGCGIAMDRRLGAELKRIKPRLNSLKELSIDDANSQGAKILVSPKIAQVVPAKGLHLCNGSDEWGKVAGILGISTRFTVDIVPTDAPYLVNGYTLATFSDDEIKCLLQGKAVLDAAAAQWLLEHGFGDQIGVDSAVIHSTLSTPYSYEEIDESDPSIYGLAYPRITAQRAALELTAFSPVSGAEVLTTICGPDHARLFPGCIKYRNRTGGEIVTLAYTIGDREQEWFYFGFFNPFRRIFMQKLLRELSPGVPMAFAENEPFHCYRNRLANGSTFAAILNATTDNLPNGAIRFTAPPEGVPKRLLPDGSWSNEGMYMEKCGNGDLIIHFDSPIPIHEGEFICFV